MIDKLVNIIFRIYIYVLFQKEDINKMTKIYMRTLIYNTELNWLIFCYMLFIILSLLYILYSNLNMFKKFNVLLLLFINR